METKLYKVQIVNETGQVASVFMQAKSLEDLEFTATADPQVMYVMDVELLGVVEPAYHGLSVVDAYTFREHAEQSEGGYAGLDFSLAFPMPEPAAGYPF